MGSRHDSFRVADSALARNRVMYRDDYARAGIRMLPVIEPDGKSTTGTSLHLLQR
jgi:heme O synthase-like polyprenyltransferase